MLHEPRVLFLDEPTAGVDVHSRGLFWEAIQDEAARGVTVFVTTHFLEEADYCDRVSFIDAGRLVADATPDELRRRFSDGYRITIEAPAADHAKVLAVLGDLAGGVRTERDGTLTFTVPALGPDVLDRLGTLDGIAVQIVEAPMTEVFRRVLQGVHAA
jgi:ABC-2 type transport system ATP-binding protein